MINLRSRIKVPAVATLATAALCSHNVCNHNSVIGLITFHKLFQFGIFSLGKSSLSCRRSPRRCRTSALSE
jgi:hypothetical protein